MLFSALEKHPGQLPPAYYYKLRKKEFDFISSNINLDKSHRLLEIGCGCGFQAALFSQRVGTVFAMDKYNIKKNKKGVLTYGIRLEQIGQIKDLLKSNNLYFQIACVEALPYKKESMDIAFLSYVLQYLPERDKALGQIYRVLKKEGLLIIVVTTAIDKLLSILRHFMVICKKLSLEKLDIEGAYSSNLEELIKSFPYCWIRLIKEQGFEVVDVFSLRFLPFELFGSDLKIELYEKFSFFVKFVGTRFPCKYFGNAICLIAQKK